MEGRLIWNDNGLNLQTLTTSPFIWNPFTYTETIDSAAPAARMTIYQTNALARWENGVTNTAESGSNVGSDWILVRYNDAGTLVDEPLFVQRSTGIVTATDGVSAGFVTTTPVAFANLPAGAAAGTRAAVNNTSACTFNSAVNGSGALFCPVIWNGSSWVGG